MGRLLISALLAAALAAAVAGPAAADRPTAIQMSDTFSDVDPCTGQAHVVTIAITFHVHDHGDMTVARGVRTLTTTAGYEGGGTSSYVLNGNVELFRFTDLLADDSGNRIRASGVFLLDLDSGVARVDTFALTCVGA